jgi:hypothetical protein
MFSMLALINVFVLQIYLLMMDINAYHACFHSIGTMTY